MPAIEHIGNGVWYKPCTVCKTEFRTRGSSYNEVVKNMLGHFGQCLAKSDGMKSECKSCNSHLKSNRSIAIHRDELLALQDGKCGICCKEISFKNATAQVDHDHVTGAIRKVLCKLCNRHMAAVDDTDWLIKGIAYRDAHRG